MAPALRRRFARLVVIALAAAAAAATAADDTPGSPAEPTFKLGARIQIDHDRFGGLYSDTGRRVSETYLRRATLELSGRAFAHWQYGLDIAPDEDGAGLLDTLTLTLAYTGLGATVVTLGRFKPDVSLEEAISSNSVTGIERSAIWDLAPEAAERGGSWGVELRAHGRRHHASLGIFRKPEQHAQALRLVFAPVLQPGRTVHLGVSVAREDIDAGNGRIRTRLGVRGVSEGEHGHRTTLAPSAGTRGFDGDRAAVLEFAFGQGPFSVQSEVLQRRLSGAGGRPNRVARGLYLQLAQTLTGETRPYKLDGGKFDAIKPAIAALGAWEVFYRHDRLAVDGEPGLPGSSGSGEARARVHALGLNWYVKRSLKVSVNHLWGDTHGIANAAGDTRGRALSLRLQLLI